MNNIFQKTSAYWAKYSEYEFKQGKDGTLFITPASTSKPSVYDPLRDAEAMVIDALNVGRLAIKVSTQHGSEEKLKQAVLDFVSKYGLLGFMTALPTTLDFIDYDAVYLPKNHFIKAEPCQHRII